MKKMRKEDMPELPSVEFSSRGKEWMLERDRLQNVIAKSEGQRELIVDEELVNMNLEELAVLLESGGW
ncbi:MAG: hypothetical protein ABIH83_03385 [Candidatus Micrarchaeota archaeon]